MVQGQDRPIGPSSFDTRNHLAGHLTGSYASSSYLAERVLADDIAQCSDDEQDDAHHNNHAIDDSDDLEHHEDHHPMYRRPSGVAYGGSRAILNPQNLGDPGLSALERQHSRNAEASLLRDNHILPPKHPRQSKPGLSSRLYQRLFSTKVPRDEEEGRQSSTAARPSESSPLLGEGGSASSATVDEDELEEQWEQAVASGKIRTTWQRETKVITQYSVPLIITFFLQYSINVAAVFAVGRISKQALGAVSLAHMTSAITCIAPFQGLATSLDTLCAQAYGSGHKHLVGLQFQRMTCFLFTLMPFVAVLWFFAGDILKHLVPDPESVQLAATYLRILIFSIPGLILFECGKRFTQAQGLFRATTYVLIVAAPFNIFMIWLLVWHFDVGFIGAPISIAVTDNLLPILLFLYVRFVDGSQCWGGFSKRALSNWWVMIRLALPGMIMVEAEWLAFELITLLASQFGPEYLAAQSAVITLASITYQIPFPVSIAASTRVANLMGANLVDAAKTAAKVTFFMASFIGVLNLVVFSSLRFKLPLLFTDDEEVIDLIAHVLPIVAIMQVFDGLSAGAHGLLRGVGKQSIGGPANLISYYVISLPISLGLAFGLDLKLEGLWGGVSVGLMAVSIIEYLYLWYTDWHSAAAEAAGRNEAG